MALLAFSVIWDFRPCSACQQLWRHITSISSVSFLLLGGSFLAIVGVACLPLAIILLSRVSRSIAQMRTAQLQTPHHSFCQRLIELSAFVCLQMIVFSDVIVRAWVGPSFLGGNRIIQITILAVPFYFFYCRFASVINAAAVKAYKHAEHFSVAGRFPHFYYAGQHNHPE